MSPLQRKASVSFLVWSTFLVVQPGHLGCGKEANDTPSTPPESGYFPISHDPHAWAKQDESRVSNAIKTLASPVLVNNERIVHATARTMKHTKKTFYRLVLFDEVTNKVRKVAIDNKGKIADYQKGLEANLSLDNIQHGKLTKELSGHLKKQKNDADTTEVTVWYKTPPPPPRPDAHKSTSKIDKSARLAKLQADLLVARSTLVGEIKAKGGTVTYEARNAPFVIATLSKKQIHAFLKHKPDVSTVRLSRRQEKGKPLSSDSSIDMRLYDYHNSGYYGSGVRVGIIESCRECGIWFGNQVLTFPSTIKKNNYTSCTTSAQCKNNPLFVQDNPECIGGECYGLHPTWVTGMIGMYISGAQDPNVSAKSATIVHANDESATHGELFDWLAEQGVSVVNESYEDHGTDWHTLDYFARHHYITTVRAAGNSGDDAVSNCIAFNIVCVGAYNPHGTVGPEVYWNDDTFCDFTSTKNPPTCVGQSVFGCDRETPAITGHGDWVTSSTLDPSDPDGLISEKGGVKLWGTSFAAPAIAGLVALMQNKDAIFKNWPELVRTMLMVSAHHDVDIPVLDKTYSDYRWPDEKDGAGVPDASRINTIMTNGTWDGLVLTPSDFDANKEKVVATVDAWMPGTRIRAAIAWSTCPNSYDHTPWPLPPGPIPAPVVPGVAADFDLHIVDPLGNTIFAGASYAGSQEIGEIVTTWPGQYKIIVKHYRWDPCYSQQKEYVGFTYHAEAPPF